MDVHRYLFKSIISIWSQLPDGARAAWIRLAPGSDPSTIPFPQFVLGRRSTQTPQSGCARAATPTSHLRLPASE